MSDDKPVIVSAYQEFKIPVEWLARHDAEVAAKVWEEAAKELGQHKPVALEVAWIEMFKLKAKALRQEGP